MTSEILLMNRYAAVLAADSATTSSHWDPEQGRSVSRYFKGATKMFQMSSYHPVGIMNYDTASLHGVPWEILIKDFRVMLKDRVHDKLVDYASAFFEFVKTQTIHFPPGYIDSLLAEQAELLALSICYRARNDPRVVAAKSESEVGAAYAAAFADQVAEINGIALPKHFTNDDLNGAVASHGPMVARKILDSKHIPTEASLSEIEVADAAIRYLFKTYNHGILNMTGVVVVGFGEKDVFPGYLEYACYGFMAEKLLVDEVSTATIDFNTTAEIKAFAVTAMVDTFEMGFSGDVYSKILSSTKEALHELAERIKAELKAGEIPNLGNHVDEVAESHRSSPQSRRNRYRRIHWPFR
jgi:hypothetical protein